MICASGLSGFPGKNVSISTAHPTPYKIEQTQPTTHMAFPGMTPPMGGMPGGAGGNTQGINEQEQAMVKMVILGPSFNASAGY